MYQPTSSLLDGQGSDTKVISNNTGTKSMVIVQPVNEEETWIEVSNKSNQTPSHWVYDDMITKDKVYSPVQSKLMRLGVPN